jgi:hypothetical protein
MQIAPDRSRSTADFFRDLLFGKTIDCPNLIKADSLTSNSSRVSLLRHNWFLLPIEMPYPWFEINIP